MISNSRLSKKQIRALAKDAGAENSADVELLGRLADSRHKVGIIAELWGKAITRPTAEQLLFYDMLFERGRFFRAEVLPTDYCYGEPNQCYGNSFDLAKARPELTYCEGFAALPIGPARTIDFRHAWCATSDRVVIDVTLDGELGMIYFGVTFTQDEIARFGGGKALPLIDEMTKAKYRLLNIRSVVKSRRRPRS